MIPFTSETLSNGLTILVNEDKSTPMAVCNMLYKLGAVNEDPEITGLAHLFEHLMFGGTKHVPDFDSVLQYAGGDNNAFTNNDVTNYYDILPAQNIETALWLEADRMQNLKLDAQSIKVQKDVVMEEFKETHLNQAYGDLDQLLRSLAYKRHPYRWSTIGLSLEQIQKVDRDICMDFRKRYYAPNNAILAISGNVNASEIFMMAEEHFGHIKASEIPAKDYPQESLQNEQRRTEKEDDVPHDVISVGFHMPSRLHDDYYTMDLISDILANGNSSRFKTKLVKQAHVFTELDAYICGSIDPGLLVITGYPESSVSLNDAEQAIFEELDLLANTEIAGRELQKAKNKALSSWMFINQDAKNKAFHLAYFEMLGNASLINTEEEKYREVVENDIQKAAKRYLRRTNSSVINYKAKK